MIDKEYKNQIIIGSVIAVVASVLFWIIMYNNTNSQLAFLKPAYFLGVLVMIFYGFVQNLYNKYKTKKSFKSKFKIVIYFIILATSFYFLGTFILNHFSYLINK